MSLHVRYQSKDENNETRVERNARFGQDDATPEITIPENGAYLWVWYWSLSDRLKRVHDGGVFPIPPSEYLAWKQAREIIVYPYEYAILCQMDDAYCDAMSKEIAEYQARLNDKLNKPPTK